MAKENKIEKLYSLYEKNGLVKNVSMEQFSQATPEQQKKLFDLANSKGLVKEVTFDTFSSAWTPQGEGSKKKTKDQDSMDSPSVSAQSTSLLGLESRPEEQPDWLVQNSSQAQTSSLKSLKDSIEWYQDFYKDAPFALIDERGEVETLPRGKQLLELRNIYNERAKKEAPIKERASILKSEAYKKYLSENIEKGFLTEDEANSLAPTDVFELVATNKLSSDNVQGWGPRVFSTETMSVEEMTDKIKKSSIQSEIKDLSEKTKNEILATIPEEERTPEKLAELEQELYTKADLFINLNPEESSVVGLDFNQGLLNTITEKSRLLGKVGIQLVSDLTNTIVDITELATGAEGLEYQPIFLGGLSAKTLELSAKELDSKITKYESDSFDALMSGDLMEVANQSINMMIESAPYTAIAALSPNVYASYALIGGLVANQQYNQVKDQDWFTDLNAIEKAGYLTAYGAFEGIGETVGGVVLKNTVKNLLVPSLKETAENSLKQFIKGYAKSLGISLREEFLAEAVTGVGQLVTDAAAKGELDKIDLDMILDTAIRQGTAGALAGGARTTATASFVGAIRTPEFLGLMNKQKGLIDEMNKANTLEEKEIILSQIEDLLAQSDRLRQAHQQVVNQMSSEDLFTYSGALAKFNELKIKYDSLKNKGVAEGAAAEAIKTQMADAVKVIDDIQNKYKAQQESTQPVQETEVFREREQGAESEQVVEDEQDVSIDELENLEAQIAKEERIRKDREQPQRKPRPSQIERPDQEKPVLAMEMIGERVQDENGVVGTLTEENGRLVWVSEDGNLVREGGSTEDAPTVTLKDMNLSIIPTDITEPVGLTQGEPVGVPPLTNDQKQEVMLEEAITKEELDALPEKEFEKMLAESEKEVERFNEEILEDVERESKRDERLIFKLGGRTFAVGLNKEGGNTVSEKNASGRFVAVGDTKLREDAIAEYNRLREDRESQRLQDAIDLAQEFKKEQEDRFLSLLDAAIEATSTKGKLYDGTLGLPLFVANSSLKVVRAAYKAGKSLSEAINDGIKYLKSKGYNIDDLEYRKYVVSELKKPTKPQSNATKKPSPKKIPVGKQSQTKAFTSTQFTRIVEQVDKMGIKEGINQARERQKQFSKQAKAVIKNTLKGIKGITKQQYETIASKAAGVKFNSIASLDNFVDYANKVIESADYAVKFENGVKAKSRIKKKANAKSTLANQRNLANAFGQINPANVDIDKYNEVAKAIEANLSKVKVAEGDVITPERSTTFAIEKQLEELNAQQEEAILAKTAEKNNMTVEELKASLQESKALNTELDNVPENSSEEEYQKARMAIEKKVQAKKQAILDYLSQKVELLDPDGQLGYMTDMELERLSNSDLINMEAIVDNFLKNGVVYNDLRIRSLSSAIKRVPLVLSNPKPVFKKIKGRALKTMGQMVDSYMGGVKVTGELLADLGYFNFQKARESVEKSNNYFKKALFDIIEKGKAKGTRSEKSSAIRQIYAIALQLPEYSSRTGQPIETAFLVFKENLKTTKITLENNGKDNTGYYEAVSEIVDKLDGINSIEDIPISKEDKAIVDKVIDLHKEVEPELAQFIRSAKNKDLPQNPQYLSIQIMGVNEGIFSSNLEETKLSFLDYVLGQNPMPKRSKTLEERGSFKPLKEGEAYNLNFNNVQQSAYYNNLFEARLSEPLMTIQMVTNTKDVKEHLGDNLVNDFRTLLTQEKNQSLVRNSIYTGDNKYVRAGLSVVNTLRNLSVRYIFGRVDQVLRQVPVFLNTPVAITRDFGYSGLYNAFSIRGVIDAVGDREGARKLIDLTTTGRRDLASEVLLTETPTQARVRRFVSDYSGGKIEATTTFLKNFDENVVKKAQMSFLQGTDRYASLSTVVMLYRAYLTNEGVKVFDNSKEADLLAKGDPIRERAMSYAETQMKRDHNVNIREELATLFQTTTSKSTKDLVLQTAFKVVEGLFLPFSRFMLNKKVSMVNDASKLSNPQTTREGAINMVGHTAELFTFAFSASYVTPVILDFVRGLLFDEDEEEKEKRETVTPDELYEQRQRDRKFYTTWISEYSPIAIGDYGTKVTVDGLNFIYFLGDAKLNPDMYESLQGKDFTSKFNSYYRLNQQPLDIYRKYEDASKPFSLGETGVYGIAASAMMQGYSLMTTTNGEYTDAYGNKRFVSEEDADILRKAGLLQFIGAMGYSIGEITFSSMREASEVKRERSYDSEIERAVMNYDIESAINSTVQNLDEFGLIQGKTKSESQVSKAKAKLKMKPNQFFKTAEARSRGNHKELIFLINQRYKELDTKEEKELFESQLLDYIGTENDPLKYYLLDSGKNEILGMVK